jgi:hypothetical protein
MIISPIFWSRAAGRLLRSGRLHNGTPPAVSPSSGPALIGQRPINKENTMEKGLRSYNIRLDGNAMEPLSYAFEWEKLVLRLWYAMSNEIIKSRRETWERDQKRKPKTWPPPGVCIMQR